MNSKIEKDIKIEKDRCVRCMTCQFMCSYLHTNSFNPLNARISIKPNGITFTDECVRGCTFCVKYCAYGALSIS